MWVLRLQNYILRPAASELHSEASSKALNVSSEASELHFEASNVKYEF